MIDLPVLRGFGGVAVKTLQELFSRTEWSENCPTPT